MNFLLYFSNSIIKANNKIKNKLHQSKHNCTTCIMINDKTYKTYAGKKRYKKKIQAVKLDMIAAIYSCN